MTFTDADETLYVTGDVNMRAIPVYGSSVLQTLPKGAEVHCTGKATEADGDGITWYRVEFGDKLGYASGRYLAAEMPE